MNDTLRRWLVPTASCGLGLFVGFAMGLHQGFNMGMRFLETEVDGTLGMHVEAASCVRIGDTQCALKALDRMIDAAVMSLAIQPVRHLGPGALSQARLYRELVPAAGSTASEVENALQKAPPMELPKEGGSTSGLVRLARQRRG